MMIRLLFILLFAVPLGAENYCIDHLLAGKYPEVVLEHHPKGFACGFIWEVDGSPKTDKVITQLLASGKCTKIRIHLSWKDSHTFTSADIPIAVKKSKDVLKIVNQFPKVEFYISPWLEHRANLSLVQSVRKEVTKIFPSRVKYVNSYIAGGAYLPGVINEVHHSLSAPKGDYIHSFDGLGQLDVDMNKYKDIHKKAELFCAWEWFENSKVSKKDKTLRQNRKLIPQPRMIKVLELQLLNRYPPKHKLLAGRIYKAYAEAHLDSKGQADSRSYAITYLTTGRPKEIIFKVKGKVLLKLQPTSTMHGNQRIYRNIYNPFALNLWNDAKKLNKKGMVNVWEDKQRVGRVLPLFRAGEYRNVDL